MKLYSFFPKWFNIGELRAVGSFDNLFRVRFSLHFTDEPADASNLARHKDGFEDILEERRHSSDFKYCIRPRIDVPSYKYCKPRTPDEIKEHVINSDRVKYRVEMVRSVNVFEVVEK